MNTNALKKFAQNARKKLMEQVETRLDYVLNTDTTELRERQEQIETLKKELKQTGRDRLIEKVAYTWFNRLVALRFMDVNDYQPFRLRVISPHDGYTQPELLTEAKQGHIPDELTVDRQRINDLLNGSLSSQNPQNEVFRLLLVSACNHLNSIFPFLFEPIKDYTELLLPEDLTSEFSIVQDVRDGMSAEACEEVEVIGWLYQFYISEKKDEVFASSGKVQKEEIPAATQLFTPRWIVEYMVQNTIGKLWLQNNPESSLKEQMDYYIESPSAEADDYLEIDSPEEITFLDPASGSGHILVYAFELLTKIYEEAGYPQSDIAELILTKNLHGIEIDERAAQLSGLSLMMKARDYYRRTFSKDLTPNVTCLTDLSLSEKEIKDVFDKEGIELTDEMLHDLTNMQQATNYGSLIIPHTDLNTLEKVHQELSETSSGDNLFEAENKNALKNTVGQLLTLSKKYHCVAANPPYMGSRKMNKSLNKFVKKYYPKGKKDLMTCFMEAGLNYIYTYGFISMINLPSWLFLSSFQEVREDIISKYQISSLLHMGRGIFGIDWGSTAFTLHKQQPFYKGLYFRLHERNFQHIYPDDIRDIFLKAKKDKKIRINFENYREDGRTKSIDQLLDKNGYKIAFTSNQEDFERIPGSPIGYWVSEYELDLYKNGKLLEYFSHPAKGIDTGENDFFLRYWNEISYQKIDFKNGDGEWVPYNKGGDFRRWYGNREHVLRWSRDGSLLEQRLGRTKRKPTLRNKKHWFKKGFTWSTISSSGFSARFCEEGALFDNGGCTLFDDDNLLLWGTLLNTKVADRYLEFLSPTLNFQPGDIGAIAVHPDYKEVQSHLDLTEQNINIAKEDWNSRETSWGFKQNELIRVKDDDSINLEESYDLYKQYWKVKFFRLHNNEKKLNKKFIEIYGLEGELDPEVPLEDITIQQEETEIKNGKIEFKEKEVFSQFISYAVGCMFGRYSLDKEGLILANKGETLEDYLEKVERNKTEVSFLPDDDNIIPVLDEDWFEDDIVGRFRAFLKASFGEEHFEKNLAFVEEHITHGGIRKYFNKTFYRDHYKRYNKRPIYWMFSSPNGVFKALIYMHRYTPDTLNRMLNDYLREYKSKLTYRKDHLQEIINSSSDASEVNQAEKEQRKLEEMLRELEEYERNVLMPLATERIEIDLDDGVLVNYNKFGKAVEEIRSVNDPDKKKKVKEFDWIDGDEIR